MLVTVGAPGHPGEAPGSLWKLGVWGRGLGGGEPLGLPVLALGSGEGAHRGPRAAGSVTRGAGSCRLRESWRIQASVFS